MLERKVCKIGKEWYGGGIVQGVFDIDSGKALLIVDEKIKDTHKYCQ